MTTTLEDAPTRLSFPTSALLFGVIGPLAMLAVELTWRPCGENFFDPLPTLWHVLLVLTLPLGTLAVIVATRAFKRAPRSVGILHGIALTIAAVYAIWCVPALPMALSGILDAEVGPGFTLCVMAPFFAFAALLRCRADLNALAPRRRAPGLWPGILLGVLLLLASESAILITQLSLRMMASHSSAEQRNGLLLLRAVGDEQVILHICYGNTRYLGFFGGLEEMTEHTPQDTARDAYNAKTGDDYYEATETMFGGTPIMNGSYH